MNRNAIPLVLFLLVLTALQTMPAQARNAIKRDFFDVYPQAEGTQLDDLPGNNNHCGVCHFDFGGGGSRNPYGLAIEVRLSGGMTNTEAVLDIENFDSDNDGFSNLVEITDTAKTGFYVCAQLPLAGLPVASAQLETADYGS